MSGWKVIWLDDLAQDLRLAIRVLRRRAGFTTAVIATLAMVIAANTLIFSVIGRVCPWEIGHYLVRRRWARIKVRYSAGPAPVRMNGRIVWTRYYTPREFYRQFQDHFELVHHGGLCVFAPPPYLTGVREKHPGWYRRLWRIDRLIAGWPLLRTMGDHFLMVMRKR